jgi:hypothetical protein
MKTMLRRTAALLGALLLAASAQAQISDAQAEALMRLSGQWAQLESLSEQMRSGLLEGLGKDTNPPSEALQAKVKAAAAQAFTVERARQLAQRSVAENTRTEHLAELMRWYESPVARRITQAEVEDTARAESDMKARTQRGMALVQAASPKRQQLLVRLVEVTRAPRAGADIIISLGVQLPLALARLVPPPQPIEEAQLRATLEDQRAQLTQAFEIITLAGFAIAYEGLPDDALEAYAKFMATSAGEHFNDVGVAALEAAMLGSVAALKP